MRAPYDIILGPDHCIQRTEVYSFEKYIVSDPGHLEHCFLHFRTKLSIDREHSLK